MLKRILLVLALALVMEAIGADFYVYPTKVNISTELGINPNDVNIGIVATGDISLTLSSSVSWLTLSASSVNITTNNLSTNITASINADGLALGNYEGSITITDGTNSYLVNIYLAVDQPARWRTKAGNVMFNHTKSEVNPTKVEPKFGGAILIYTVSNYVYISKGATTNDWIQISP